MTDPRGVGLKYEYGFFGATKVDYPDAGLRSDDVYEYSYNSTAYLDENGTTNWSKTRQVKKKLDTGDVYTNYDELGRVKQITYPDVTIKNYYDQAGRLSKTESLRPEVSTIVYEYDLTGNVKQVRHTYGRYYYQLDYTYDEKGNLKTITYPGNTGITVNYNYDQYGRVQSITNSGGTPLGIITASYYNNGVLKNIAYPNGIFTEYVLNKVGRVETIKNRVMEYGYQYDGKGNVTTATSKKYVSGSLINDYSYSYLYDDLDRLKQANLGGTTNVYKYDGAGNRTKLAVNGAITSYTYHLTDLNLLNAVNGLALSYDRWGNITWRENGDVYSYNTANQLTRVTKNGVVAGEYYYNSEGKRYKKVEGGKTTYYVYSGENILYEETGDKRICYVYLNGVQVAKVEYQGTAIKASYYHTDNLGSTRAVTDAQGNLLGTLNYGLFGENSEWKSSVGVEKEVLSYTTKEQDNSTGLYYFNARYYEPNLGRFINEDKVSDGDNWFIFVRNNSLKFTDKNGMEFIELMPTGENPFDYREGGHFAAWYEDPVFWIAFAAGGGIKATYQLGREGYIWLSNTLTQNTSQVMSNSKGTLVIEQGGNFSASEIRAAEYMKNLGNDVILRMPQGTRAGGGTSDLLINGLNYDVYTPITNNASRIISGIAAKKDQAVGIVLDLSQTTVTAEQLGDIMARLVGKGVTTIKEVIIIK